MKQDNIKLNTILYTTLIKGFAREKKLVKALEIYKIMLDSKRSKPNIVTFNTLIDCAVRCNDVKTANNLLDDMHRYKIKQDVITFSTLARGYCNSGLIEEAINLLESMKNLNIKIDDVLINTLLDGCFKLNNCNAITNLFKYLKQLNITINAGSFCLLIKY